MTKPLISVLIDTYNQERYIEQAIVSVLEQDFPPSDLEIVVVDDGSTDGTPDIVRKFTPRVRLLCKKNGGQASALNTAFPELRAQTIALLDGDDWFARGKLTAVVNALERDPKAAAVGHGYFEVQEATNEVRVCAPTETKFLHLATPEAAREASLAWPFLRMSALTVRRKLLQAIMPIPEVLVFCADGPISVTSIAMGLRMLEDPLCYYRHHADNLYSIVDPQDAMKVRRSLETTEAMFELLEPMLVRAGVRPDSVAAFLTPPWTYFSRATLSAYGGSRLKTFRTEMRCFHWEFVNPTLGYRLFKYLVVGTTALLLPPRSFYRIKEWYTQRNLVRIREQFARSDRSQANTSGTNPV